MNKYQIGHHYLHQDCQKEYSFIFKVISIKQGDITRINYSIIKLIGNYTREEAAIQKAFSYTIVGSDHDKCCFPLSKLGKLLYEI